VETIGSKRSYALIWCMPNNDDDDYVVWLVGVLVKAMQHGQWIILDELNLAPSDVLEALNRVGIPCY